MVSQNRRIWYNTLVRRQLLQRRRYFLVEPAAAQWTQLFIQVLSNEGMLELVVDIYAAIGRVGQQVFNPADFD